MSGVQLTVKGGDKIAKVLKDIADRAKGGIVNTGFLEGATYPAATQKRLKNGKRNVTKISESTTLNVAQVAFWNEFGTTQIPARPFFRDTIKESSPEWGGDLAKILKASKYNSSLALELMGTRIKDQITKQIAKWPADNADSTAEAKGFNHGLVDTGVMQRSVDYEVKSS